MADTDAFGKLELELRRGVVVLATLSQLRAPRYGYELRQALADRGMPIEEGTLYPLAAPPGNAGRAEKRMADRKRLRRGATTRLNADGRKLFKKLTESWQGMNGAMDRLLEED